MLVLNQVAREKDYKATKDFTSALKFLDAVNILDRAQVRFSHFSLRKSSFSLRSLTFLSYVCATGAL